MAETTQQMTLDQALKMAQQLHAQGNLREAENIYRQILQYEPDHPDALHGLGAVALQAGANEDALRLMARSGELKPGVAFFHKNLATV